MYKSLLKIIIFFSIILNAGCASYKPEKGTNIDTINYYSLLVCAHDSRPKGKQILKSKGIFNNTPSIKIYEIDKKMVVENPKDWCFEELYFMDDILITRQEALEASEIYLKNQIIKINSNREEISRLNLKLIGKINSSDSNAISVYEAPNGDRKYIKNNEFISEIDISQLIDKFNKDKETKEKQALEERLKAEKDLEIKKKLENEIKIALLELNTRRKNIDLIAQVLNYSSGWDDNGESDRLWAPVPEKSCLYKVYGLSSNTNSDLIEFMFRGTYSVIPKMIDINTLDPNSIRFDIDIREKLGIFKNLLNPQVAFQTYTIVKINDKNLFTTPGELDLTRLRNGWRKVFASKCQGKTRAF